MLPGNLGGSTLESHKMRAAKQSARIIQATFKKKGGNLHMLEVYAPHSDLDFETDREPFWDTLEAHLSTIPQSNTNVVMEE